MSPMEQALRDEIAWHEKEIEWLGGDLVLFSLGSVLDKHRARLAALTAALPAPGEAVLPSAVIEAGRRALIDCQGYDFQGNPDFTVAEVFRAMLSAAPPPPVEISQAQAQAMREALERGYDIGFAESGEGWNGEYGAEVSDEYYQSRKRAALASVPAAAR